MERLDYRRIIESVGDIVYLIDVKGKLLYINSSAMTILGRNPDEMIGRSLLEFMTDESAKTARGNMVTRLENGSAPSRYGVDMLTADGHVRNCELLAIKVEEGGKLLWIQGTIRDLTGAEKLRAELTNEKSVMGALVDMMGAVVVTTDMDGRIVIFNREAERKLGFSRMDMVGHGFCEAIPDCDIKFPVSRDILPSLHRMSKQPSEIQVEGDIRYVDWDFSFVNDPDHDVTGLIAVGSDQTDRIQMEMTLKEKTKTLAMLNKLGFITASTLSIEMMFRETLNDLMEFFEFEMGGAVELDLETMGGRVIAVDGISLWEEAEGIIELPGCLADRIRDGGSNLIFLDIDTMTCLEDVLPDIRSGILILLASPRGPVGAIMLFSRDEREINREHRIALEAASMLIGSSFENIILYERLNDTLESMRMYSDIMFHDIINYTIPVQGFLDLARDNIYDPTKGKKFLDKAIASQRKLDHFVENIRTLIKVTQDENAELKPVSLKAALNEAIDMAMCRFEGGRVEIEPDLESSMDGITVRADDALPHLFMNIIANAIKFSKPEAVSVSGGPDGDRFVVEVVDRGRGVPDKLKEKIFEKHYSQGTEQVGKSSGIGLAITSNLVRRYGGSVEVRDRVPGDFGKGARFIIGLEMS